MELREYWRIIRRRWWMPVALVGSVALLSALQLRIWQAQAVSYAASMRMLVGVLPAADADIAAYDPRYYGWLTSEYLVDDFTEVVRSELFARNVSARLADQTIIVPPGAIQGSAATGKQHRIITLNFSWGDPAQIAAIANAAADELMENASYYFSQLGSDGAGVTLLDGPTVSAVGPSLRSRLELPLRLLLALVIGLGLVFLLAYLDTTLRREEDVAALGLTLLGAIPRQRRKR
jgi:capsular polysaccharide biosynthesis protein